MEIGVDVFYDVYDWHVRHQQQIQITRIAEQRLAIQFMFTQLIAALGAGCRELRRQAYDR